MTDIFELIAAERRALADDLEKLSDAQWTTPSALKGWQVKHVAAHLVWPLEASLPKTMFQFAINGFNFAKTADYVADRETRSARELAAVMRAKAASRFTPPGMGAEAPLTDIVVHALDIRHVLGLPHTYPVEAAKAVLDHLLKPVQGKFFRVPLNFHFVCEDVGWSGGNGATVSAPANLMMLALTRRRAGIEALQGEGAEAFRAGL